VPIVRIDITGPKSPGWKKALLTGACDAIVESLGVERDRVSVRVVETPDDCVDVPDCRTDRYTIVEVIMYEGRTEEAKHALVSALRERLAADPGIEPTEVSVIIRDPSKVDLDVLPGEAAK
jgi:phenylpyruvate tautomerase PptA (4-oxalocrotonate tautomerase family)